MGRVCAGRVGGAVNGMCTCVYRSAMRLPAFLFLLVATGTFAQPGWQELQFSFILEHHGVEVPGDALQKGNDFHFEVEGTRTRPFSFNRSRFVVVQFPAERSDITRHRDTLWLRIRHRHEGVMAIGFPPRAGLRSRYPYLTEHMVVRFGPGRVMVTELEKELHVSGTMVGIGQLWNAGPVYAPSASCGSDTVRHVTASVGGAMDFRIRCRPSLGPEGLPMADMSFFVNGAYQPELRMNIRGSALGGEWPLDTVRFAPANYIIADRRRKELDLTVQRDTVLGWDRSGNVVRLSRAHPTANDSLRFTFWWLGAGENVRIDHRLVQGFEGESTLLFTVQRSPIDVPDVFIRQREITVVVPPLARRGYEVAVTYEEDAAFPAPRFPALHGQQLQVR